VGESVGGDSAALTRLPADLLASLRETFADDVAERLPRLVAAASGQTHPQVLRDAHTLVSSAAVVGATEVARAARDLEDLLLSGGVTQAAAARLVEELQRWTA
jgi:HPt (histidine-containing phosphotransfer) domain-containing protein